MTAHTQIERLTLDDYLRRYEADGPFAIIAGEHIPMSPTVARHNLIMKRLFLALYDQAEGRGLGEVFSEMPFVLLDSPDWVTGARVPDVMFYTAARLATYRAATPGWEGKPYILVPDLVAEVVSPHDRYSALNLKVDAYLADGVPLIWVIDPQRARVTVHSGQEYLPLTPDDTLTGANVLPDFALPVADILTG